MGLVIGISAPRRTSAQQDGQPEGTHTVLFIDVDGTILKTQYVADGGTATPPANPSREKCTFVKWLNAYSNITKDTEVFALYKSADGNSWYRVKANANDVMRLGVKNNTSNITTIDWGDGTAHTYSSQSINYLQHRYNSAFDGWVKVSSQNEASHSLAMPLQGCGLITEMIIGDNVNVLSSFARNCTNLSVVVIPETVSRIDGDAFAKCLSIMSIALPDGVTITLTNSSQNMVNLRHFRIPADLTNFNICIGGSKYIKRITFPPGLVKIADSAFVKNVNLLEADLPQENAVDVGTSAFLDCHSLKRASIPHSTVVKANVFQNCYSLQECRLDDEVTTIRQNAFNSCFSLKAINISDNVTTIENYAFQNCASLGEVNLAGVTSIGAGAFYNCLNAKFTISQIAQIPPKINMFYNCPNLTGDLRLETEQEIPYGAFAYTGISTLYSNTLRITRTAQEGAFSNCVALARVELPNVTEIYSQAFLGCSALALAIIGGDVTNIGFAVFKNCISLERLVVKAATPPTLAYDALQDCSALAGIYVPDASVEAYKTATNWAAKADIIKPLSEFVE